MVCAIAGSKWRGQESYVGHCERSRAGTYRVRAQHTNAYESCCQRMGRSSHQEYFIARVRLSELDVDCDVEIVAGFAVFERSDLRAAHVKRPTKTAVVRVVDDEDIRFRFGSNLWHTPPTYSMERAPAIECGPMATPRVRNTKTAISTMSSGPNSGSVS